MKPHTLATPLQLPINDDKALLFLCLSSRSRLGLCGVPTGHDHASSLSFLVFPFFLHAADSWP